MRTKIKKDDKDMRYKGYEDDKGNVFKSLKDIGEYYNISAHTARYRIRHGIPLDAPISNASDVKYIGPDGKIYGSSKEMAADYGMRPELLTRRLKKGMSPEKAVSKEKLQRGTLHPCVGPDGKNYKSVRELCKAYDADEHVVSWRLTHGWSIEKAITEPASRPPKTVYDSIGRVFGSITALCKYYMIEYRTLSRKKMPDGDITEAIIESVIIRRYSGLKISRDAKCARCVRYPYFEIESKNDTAYIAHIDHILGVYREYRAGETK